MRANSILAETHDFPITTMPGIRPVFVQQEQVEQASAINGRLSTDRGPAFPASSA